MKRQEMKEKRSSNTLNPDYMVAQKVYSAEHKRMDIITSTWLTAAQNEKKKLYGKRITWHKPLNDVTG